MYKKLMVNRHMCTCTVYKWIDFVLWIDKHKINILARILNGIFVNRNFRLKIVLTKIGFI